MRTCLLLLTTPFVVAACEADAGPSADGPDVVTETIGDTTVVRTVSGSVWGAEAALVPEISVGEVDGAEEYLFGSISSIAVNDDRDLYVLDGQAQHVRVFDSAGVYVETLGRRGEGPGEFGYAEAIALLLDGRLVVRDSFKWIHQIESHIVVPTVVPALHDDHFIAPGDSPSEPHGEKGRL